MHDLDPMFSTPLSFLMQMGYKKSLPKHKFKSLPKLWLL